MTTEFSLSLFLFRAGRRTRARVRDLKRYLCESKKIPGVTCALARGLALLLLLPPPLLCNETQSILSVFNLLCIRRALRSFFYSPTR